MQPISRAKFVDKLQYEGLSSMWGSKDDLLQIELNGAIFEVRDIL
jgi:hypothetical protein